VLCSSARRARETLEGIGVAGRHLIEPELYAARTQDLLERLQRVPDDVASVMVIGHNPTMQTLVLTLASPAAELSEARAKFPTGALATLTFDAAWRELGAGRARLTAFVRPKALTRH
jgi:phosphohistidine phosphatase